MGCWSPGYVSLLIQSPRIGSGTKDVCVILRLRKIIAIELLQNVTESQLHAINCHTTAVSMRLSYNEVHQEIFERERPALRGPVSRGLSFF